MFVVCGNVCGVCVVDVCLSCLCLSCLCVVRCVVVVVDLLCLDGVLNVCGIVLGMGSGVCEW